MNKYLKINVESSSPERFSRFEAGWTRSSGFLQWLDQGSYPKRQVLSPLN